LRVGAIPSFAGLDLAALISRFIAANPWSAWRCRAALFAMLMD
jgi:hypothetical protein